MTQATAARTEHRPGTVVLAAALAWALTLGPAAAHADTSRALPPPATQAPSYAWRPWQGSTVGLQVAGGLVGGAGGALVGGLLGAVSASNNSGGDGFAALGGFVLGGAVGVLVGTGVGVAAVGDWSGGNGDWLWTILGSVGGTVLGIAIGANLDSDDPFIPILVGGLVGGSTGGIVAYHSTATAQRLSGSLLGSDGRRLVLGAPSLQPLFASDGRLVGATTTLVGLRF